MRAPNGNVEHALQIGPLVFLWQYGRSDGRRFWNVGVMWR